MCVCVCVFLFQTLVGYSPVQAPPSAGWCPGCPGAGDSLDSEAEPGKQIAGGPYLKVIRLFLSFVFAFALKSWIHLHGAAGKSGNPAFWHRGRFLVRASRPM